MVNFGQKTAQVAICLGLFAVALLLRAIGADFGFFHGDERINDSARFLAGELVPSQHFYPPFFNYLNGVSLVGLFGYGLLTGMWSNTADFRQVYFDDPTPFYVTARYVTAAIGALSAPLFYACARRLGMDQGYAIGVAATAVLFPLAVFMAHIAKGDTALAVACVSVVWAFFMRVGANHRRRWDVAIGVLVALAFGFKQSALLVLGPLAIAMIVVLARRESLAQALRSFALSVAVLLVLWPIMNIGILLDIDGFLAFQRIQSVMSVREQDGFGAGLPITFSIFGDLLLGLNPVLFAIASIVPLWLVSGSCGLRQKDALFGVWLANSISTVAISLIVGTRQPEHLFLPNLYIFLLLAALVLMDMLRAYVRLPKAIVGLTAGIAFGLLALGSMDVLRQATAQPVAEDLAEFLSADYPQARIQSGLALPVPRTVAAQQMRFARWNRLAEKYNVTMPEIAPERILTEDAEGALFWLDVPMVMSGLEGDSVQDAEYEVQPHAWPVQPIEWKLDTWLDKGFSVFVVNNLEFLIAESLSTDIRAYHEELADRCDVVRFYPARKPLFLENDITVFDCSAASA